MNYEQLRNRIRKYNVECMDFNGAVCIVPPKNLPEEQAKELQAFLTVATTCFVYDLAGEAIPEDLTDLIMDAKQ